MFQTKFLIAVLALCAMTQVGHAQEANQIEELNQDSEYSAIDLRGDFERPGRDRDGRGGHGGQRPGRPGPGRPGDGWGPGRPGPGPRPGPPGPRPPSYPPQYPPQYPPSYRTEYVMCGSYGYQYNECYVNSYRVNNIRLYRIDSREACIYGRTYGFNQNRIWTSNGCRAVFAVERY